MHNIELKDLISHLDTCYEKGEPCIHPITKEIVPDTLYDDYVARYKLLSPDDPRFNNQNTSSYIEYDDVVIHDIPMTSIEKASHQDHDEQLKQLEKWYRDRMGDIQYPFFCQSYKLDGVALSIYYEKGVLVKAGLRSKDPKKGTNVTKHVEYIDGVQTNLPEPLTCCIRGEIICKKNDFLVIQNKLLLEGKALKANPRNHAAGVMHSKDPNDVKSKGLSFIAYSIEMENPPWKTEIQRAKFSNRKLKVPFVQVRNFRFEDLENMENNVNQLDYEVDGIIISLDNLVDQEFVGRHGDPVTGNPKGKIAWKFREEVATPTIDHIEYQVGRTGSITPVANFKPVSLAGTNVSKATLHNIGFMKRNQISVGTQVELIKAGAIIPKIIGVFANPKLPQLPENCPSCQYKLKVEVGGKNKNGDFNEELVCHNPKCASKLVFNIKHFLESIDVLGIGESRIRAIVDNLQVESIKDFFEKTIDYHLLVNHTDLTERQSLLLIAALKGVKKPEDIKDNDKLLNKINYTKKPKILASKFLAGLGIDGLGKTTSKAIVESYNSINKINDLTYEDLEAMDGIGDTLANSISQGLQIMKNDVDVLLGFYELEFPVSGPLTGNVYCLSGSFDKGKKYWQNIVESKGGKIASGVSRKVTHFISGPGSGSKLDKAKELNILILNETELEKELCK